MIVMIFGVIFGAMNVGSFFSYVVFVSLYVIFVVVDVLFFVINFVIFVFNCVISVFVFVNLCFGLIFFLYFTYVSVGSWIFFVGVSVVGGNFV